MSSPGDNDPRRPTRARLAVLAFLCSMTFVLYLDRVCWGQAVTEIEKELGIAHTDMGYAQTAFLLSYTLFEMPVGRWGDKFGSRGVLTRIVVWWSVFTALTGAVGWLTTTLLNLPWMVTANSAASALTILLLVRFLFGAGEAGALPNAARVVARWFPESERSLVRGLITSCMQLGGAISPMLAALLIAEFGWQWSFATFGVLGLIWAGAFYWWFRDDPAAHPQCNVAELHIIRDGARTTSHDGHAPIPWRLVLANRNVWLLAVLQMSGAFVSYLYMTWWSTYLKEAGGMDEIRSGRWASFVLGCGAVGCLSGGAIITALIRATGQKALCYRAYGCFAMLASAGLLFVGSRCESATATSVCAAAASFFALSQQATWWAAAAEISGRHIGALFGLMNGIGGLGAAVSINLVSGYVEAQKEQGIVGQEAWAPLLIVYVGVMALGGAIFPLLDVRKTIGPADPEGDSHPPANSAALAA